MKKHFPNPMRLIPALVAGLMFLAVHARATVFVSNLSESPVNGIALGSNRWLAQSFQTGTNNPDGYSLNSISVYLSTVGSPSGNLTVSLFSDNAGVPGTKIGDLSGSANPASGIYVYTASGISLSPSNNYWVVISSTSTIGSDFYYWAFGSDANYTATNGWSIDLNNFDSGDGGGSWQQLYNNPYIMAVDATPLIKIRSGVKSNASFALTFFAVTNQSYAVEASTNLATTNWLTLTNLTGGGSNQTVTLSATNPATFFRLRSP